MNLEEIIVIIILLVILIIANYIENRIKKKRAKECNYECDKCSVWDCYAHYCGKEDVKWHQK